jgi:hypothetical protein
MFVHGVARHRSGTRVLLAAEAVTVLLIVIVIAIVFGRKR